MIGPAGRFLSGLLLVCSLSVAFPAASAPQAPQSARTSTSPELPPDHWAVSAALRAEALGLLDRYMPAQRGVPRHVVATALEEAARRAAEDAPQYTALTLGWKSRFAEEFPDLHDARLEAPLRNLGSSATVAYAGHRGRAAPGSRIFPENRTGADLLPNRSELQAAVSVAVGLTPHLSAIAEPVVTADGLVWQVWDVSAGWRRMALSLGQQPIGYGIARSGGIVLTGDEPVTRVQLQTIAPFRLPGPLGGLGLVSFHGFGGWLEEPRHAGDPYIWGIAASLRPHSRLTVSIHRASIIAGDSVGTALTPRNFFWTFIGHNLLGFENEVVAAELRLRLPTERFLPITVYTEWGAEDAAGAWRDVPGRLYGLQVAALPGLPQVAVGIEHVSFAGSCCGNPPWYRHAPHTGGWVVEERPMGHPLGGQGRQTSVFSHMDLADSRLRVEAHAFRRQREGENLFVPGREGASTGFALRSSFRVVPRGDLTLAVTGEAGQGWREEAAAIGLRTFF